MSRIDELEKRVRALYEAKASSRDDIADWLYENHIFIVAKYASDLSDKFGGDKDVAIAASLLHDIADAKMSRFDKNHKPTTLEIAAKIMHESGFSKEDISIVTEDALPYHGCHGDERPKTIEGKVMATADAMAHIGTNYYTFLTWFKGTDKTSYTQVIEKIQGKIERDYHNKIQFEEIKEEYRHNYELLKELYGR